jgi:hypothetical protein
MENRKIYRADAVTREKKGIDLESTSFSWHPPQLRRANKNPYFPDAFEFHFSLHIFLSFLFPNSPNGPE